MSRKYKFTDQSKLYFVSYATVGWVDLFVRNEYKDVILKSLEHCINNKGLDVYAWCIMTSHVHLIIGTHGKPLQDIMRDHKKHTAEALKQAIITHHEESRREWMMEYFAKAGRANGNNANFQLWQQNNHPIELGSAEMLYQRLEYLHQNPVKAGFVDRAEEWSYNSAREYYLQMPGLLNGLILIEPDTRVR